MPKTTVSKANTKSPSVRTTIPEAVVESLDLKVGDEVNWLITKDERGDIVAVVKRA